MMAKYADVKQSYADVKQSLLLFMLFQVVILCQSHVQLHTSKNIHSSGVSMPCTV